MNISIFGSSLLSAYWNGAATYYRGMIRALHARGHAITFYEPDAYERQSHRDLEPPAWARVEVYQNDPEAALNALESAAGSDLVIKTSGVGVFDELLEAAVLQLQSSTTLVAFWDVDAPVTLERIEHDPEDPFRNLIRNYDLILTYGGGNPVIRGYEAFGAQACVPIYNALDPQAHFPVATDLSLAADLTFLGNRLPDREERVDEFFLNTARRLPTHSFNLGGSGWEDKALPANVTNLGHVYTARHNALYGSSLAVLNICRDSMARYGYSPATRVFEAAGAGACLITDDWLGVEEFFEPGTEWLVASDSEEVARLLVDLTKKRAREIGRAAFRRAIAEHTYEKRAAQFEALFEAAVPI